MSNYSVVDMDCLWSVYICVCVVDVEFLASGHMALQSYHFWRHSVEYEA